jgi:hypothetical protein
VGTGGDSSSVCNSSVTATVVATGTVHIRRTHARLDMAVHNARVKAGVGDEVSATQHISCRVCGWVSAVPQGKCLASSARGICRDTREPVAGSYCCQHCLQGYTHHTVQQAKTQGVKVCTHKTVIA